MSFRNQWFQQPVRVAMTVQWKYGHHRSTFDQHILVNMNRSVQMQFSLGVAEIYDPFAEPKFEHKNDINNLLSNCDSYSIREITKECSSILSSYDIKFKKEQSKRTANYKVRIK